MSALTAILVAVFLVGCNDNSTGVPEEPEIEVPTVIATSPEIDAINIERNVSVTITFSEPMDPTTINETTFTLKQGSSAVEGDVSYAGTTTTFTATFTPVNPLNASEVYTAAISVGAKSSKGVALESKTEWSFTTGGSTATLEVVELGTSGDYVILAKTAINNVPTSAITGDLGLSPAATSFITGFALTDNTGYATSDQVTGNVYAADMADPTPINLTTAVENMITAYNDAAGRPNPDFVELHTGDIGGKTLSPGLYKWTNTVTAAEDVVLSGGENEVWIFQIAENLSVSSDLNFTLSGGAQAKNIFWQVAGEVTIGTDSHFEGIILSMTGITLTTGASMNGRLLAQTAVILDANTIVEVN
ncbi:MAG: ice-binding family protein [Rhodohalobacter sp.]|nr:ice-binding family protein [Rhodohalobacter sp.]